MTPIVTRKTIYQQFQEGAREMQKKAREELTKRGFNEPEWSSLEV